MDSIDEFLNFNQIGVGCELKFIYRSLIDNQSLSSRFFNPLAGFQGDVKGIPSEPDGAIFDAQARSS